MQKCRVCGGNDFYKEAGYFFCQTCQTQNEDIREEVVELRIDPTIRLRRMKIRRIRSDQSSGEQLGWTSWELYNFVLIGLTNELIELGVPLDIKMTILQLWAMYLKKVDVAFISTSKVCAPKLAKRYSKRDAEIIYGKVRAQRKARKRKRGSSSGASTSMLSGYGSERSSFRDLNRSKRLMVNAEYDRYMQSQTGSEGDGLSSFTQSVYSFQSGSAKSSDNEGKIRFNSHAIDEINKLRQLSKRLARNKRVRYKEKHTTTQYKIGPSIITPMRLWSIIYLALRIHDQPIHLGDMLRYAREGHLSYYKLDHLLPPEVILKRSEVNFLSQNVEITHKGMRRMIVSMAKFIGVWTLESPDFGALVNRYCQELGLPKGIILYVERLIALSPPSMEFNSKRSYFPNYEARAMAYIIVVLKTLFGLDGITEYHISHIAEKINSKATHVGLLSTKLFSFREWQRYLECRKVIIVHAHFPTKLKYSPDTHGIDSLYLKFLEFINSKGAREEVEVTNHKHFLPEDLITAIKKYIADTNENRDSEIELFAPSLTPLTSYLQQLLDHPLYDLPQIVQNDFFFTKVGYMTKSNSLQKLAAECGIQLDIIDSNLHFLEKTVAPYEQPRMPDIDKLKQLVDIQDTCTRDQDCTKNTENLNDYMHRKFVCDMNYNVTKQQYYNNISEQSTDTDMFKIGDDYTFHDTLPDGRLAIPDDNDSESEDECLKNLSYLKSKGDVKVTRTVLEKYNLSLSTVEKESMTKARIKKFNSLKRRQDVNFIRNSKGQFVKLDSTAKVNDSHEAASYDDTIPKIEDPEPMSNTHTDFLNWIFNELENCENESLAKNLTTNTDVMDFDNIFNLSQLSELNEISLKPENIPNERHKFFRPFCDYWMYHCIFSRVKPKNFEVFEKTLPQSFRWLLNECAHIIEMPSEDLYEEVCLIEAYYTHILPPDNSKSPSNELDAAARNLILSKW